ncbi:hybrid-cluster NAD(P)-dependent oxidoreductase [Aliagarivorans marinus]|uniref:hybrid-cluster NAD(P)-dependent oxidoreductase n=1 Tax=Aliagarivorans marinus TaxID=561965 RepID=UPI000418B956|nr:hybrid-cluster NAD(P)-dependent oxidoreductase [Aliagarivorans marinus]
MQQATCSARGITLRCSARIQETADTVSLRLRSHDGVRPFSFHPGQFISLGIEVDGRNEYRAYSLSSTPQDDELQITVKRVPGGVVSNRIVDNIEVGSELPILAPAGEFNLNQCPPVANHGRSKVLMLSAGCGITPVYSMARHWLEQHSDIDIVFLHTARDQANIIFHQPLEQLAQNHDNFSLKLLLNDATGSHYPEGFLDAAWLNKLVPDFSERSVYLCGPEQFMQDMRSYLEQGGLDMDRFYQESFTPTKPEPTASSTSPAHDSVQVVIPQFGASQPADADSLLSEALEDAEVPVILACRSGICGSCKCKVTSGEVESSTHGPLTPEEVEQGYVLACSSTLKSDVTVEL